VSESAQTIMKPTLIIIENPSWAKAITEQLPDYTILHQTKTQGYMNTLIESHAALILVDGETVNWSQWVSTPKVSPATRRIAIILVSDDNDIRASAALHGADLALPSQDLLKNSSKIIRDYARLPDSERVAQLDCECQEELPGLAREGLKKFNEGQYYKQHDLFEELWMKTDSPVRDLYRAVLQVGIAYYQIERGNYRGALKMLQRSVQWLLILPDICQGIKVKQLRDDSFRVRAELERLGEARLDEFDKRLIHGVVLIEDDSS
jgi:uncharacterized protein